MRWRFIPPFVWRFKPRATPEESAATDCCCPDPIRAVDPFCPSHGHSPHGDQRDSTPWADTDVADFLTRDRAARAGRDPHCGLVHPHTATQRCRDGGDDQ